MERIYQLIVRNPKICLGIIALFTAFFAFHAQHIRLDSSVESLLSSDDPGKQYYAEIRQLFGSDEIGMIGVITDDIYTPEVLQKIQRLTAAIEKIDGVDQVISLMNAVDPIADVMDPPPLVPRIPSTPADFAELKEKLADRPIYLKNLVAPDGRAAAINIFFADMDDDEFFRSGIDEEVQALVEQENGPEQLYYTGLPHLKVYSVHTMWNDLARFVPMTLIFIVVVLFAGFRSLRGVLLPAVTITAGLSWTLGIMVLAGGRLSLGSVALPPLLLVLGTAYSLHVVAEYYELARPGREVGEVILETLNKTAPPVFITALTTVLGFLSLALNPITSIQEMGVYSSLGIVVALVLSLTLVPALLALLPLPTKTAETFSPVLGSALQKLCRFDLRHRTLILYASVLIAALCVWQTFSIRADSNFQSFFRQDDPIRQATDAVDQHLVGSMAFYVAIDGDEPNIVSKWDTLRRIKDLQLHIDSLPGVDKTVSLVDYCELIDRGAQSGGEGDIMISPEGEIIEAPPPGEQTTFWQNPEQLESVLQLMALSPESFARVVNADFSRTNILVRTSLSRSSDITVLVDNIQAFADGSFPPELRVRPTGNLILLTATTGDIITGQIRSLALAAGVIFILMAAMFLSLRVGLIAMVPNLFPVLVFFGLLGFSGASLNLGTSIVASIALGIAVDNTVHFMMRLSSAIRSTTEQDQALVATLGTIGKPALFATFILFLGFLVLGLSTFVPIQEFGLLSAATMLAALVGDTVLLPAILTTTRIITLWEVLCLRLGSAPHKTIPLFAGLRPLQARIVTLMGELRTFSKGETIIRWGETGTEMFVLVKGTADVFIHADGESRHVRTHQRGDVFGEMGLVRGQLRAADVVAAEDVEAIALDESFLLRMQRRYPRTGAKVFLNIARILSDRFVATERA